MLVCRGWRRAELIEARVQSVALLPEQAADGCPNFFCCRSPYRAIRKKRSPTYWILSVAGT